MKIGVALSGCDIGGVVAYHVLELLEREGILIDNISACGVPATGALLHACGFAPAGSRLRAGAFLREREELDLDCAVAGLSASISSERLLRVSGATVSAMDIASGQVVGFTNDFCYRTDSLRTYALLEPYDVLSASIGAVDGLCSYLYEGSRLCDYAVGHGCPFYPLRLAGCEKILSLSFLPQAPGSAYEVLITRRIRESCAGADLHMELLFPEREGLTMEEYQKIASDQLKYFKNQILQSLAA